MRQAIEASPGTLSTDGRVSIRLPEELAAASAWSDEQLARAGLGTEHVTLVSVGGGLASFALLDQLRIRGMATRDLVVVSVLDHPYDSFRSFARWSQLGDLDRIRSDSATRIDNPWGFPSYAMSEAVRDHRPLAVLRALAEPVLATHYTPRAERVYQGVDREAARIGWPAMNRRGLALAVRRRTEGGYFVVYLPAGAEALQVLRCAAVHLGIGHGGLELSEAAAAYRQSVGDRTLVVHAYEPHEQVYRTVADLGGGTVVVHGGGIAASQVVQRLADDRRRLGLTTTVIQVTRPDPSGRSRRGRRRPQRDGVALQAFSAPRGAFGGQLHRRLLRRSRRSGAGEHWSAEVIGKSTTTRRRRWVRTLARGRAEGWYVHLIGTVDSIERSEAEPGGCGPGPVRTGSGAGDGSTRRGAAAGSGVLTVALVPEVPIGILAVPADFVVDCTGLSASWAGSPLVDDVLRLAGPADRAHLAPASPLASVAPAVGRAAPARSGDDRHPARLVAGPGFAVARADREAEGSTASASAGAIYVSGAALSDGPVGPKDSFWGMTYAAMRIADDLGAHGLCRRATFGPVASSRAWWRWVRGKPA